MRSDRALAAALRVIIVHHKSLDTIVGTVRAIVDSGVDESNILIVDNSEDEQVVDELSCSIGETVAIANVRNAGYGAAVNEGLDWWKARDPGEFTLVATHEVRPEPGALVEMLRVMERGNNIGVVGPVLVTGSDGDLVWSAGGDYTRFLKNPYHPSHQVPRQSLPPVASARKVAWVDGAFMLLDNALVEGERFDEDFFMYVEEVHFQQKLIHKRGINVVVAGNAHVWQTSNGMPVMYRARNLIMMALKEGSFGLASLRAAHNLLTGLAKVALRKGTVKDLMHIASGTRSAFRWRKQSSMRRRISIVNPLGGALNHYTEELRHTLAEIGVEPRVLSFDEPSVSGRRPLQWVLEYVRTLVEVWARERRSAVIVTWPVVGLLDVLLLALLFGRRAFVIVHDPKPLVRALGYSRPFVSTAKVGLRMGTSVIAHSPSARNDLASMGLVDRVILLPHPMLRPVPNGRATGPVRVLGQFKRDRDLQALGEIAACFREKHALEVIGRGWPDIPGWRVSSMFVPEQEMRELISSAGAIVVPYRRFYQSGIAVRALESCVPIVGPDGSTIEYMLGSRSPLLARSRPGSWSAAVGRALLYPRDEMFRLSLANYESCIQAWSEFLHCSTPCAPEADRTRGIR